MDSEIKLKQLHKLIKVNLENIEKEEKTKGKNDYRQGYKMAILSVKTLLT